MVLVLNVNSFTRDSKINIKKNSKLSTKTSSTLFTQKPDLNFIDKKSKLTNISCYGFGLKFSCFTYNEIISINSIRAFHSSATVKIKTPNFIKNILSRNNNPSISASTNSPTSDSENGSKAVNLWVSFVSLFSDDWASKIAYNRINKKTVNDWRYDVAEAEQSNNQPNSNENPKLNNNNNNNIVNNNNSNIINNNTDNNNNLNNINNNNYNNNNNNSNNNYTSDSSDNGGDIGD